MGNGEKGKPGEEGKEAIGQQGGAGGKGGAGGAGGTGDPRGTGGEGGLGGKGGQGAQGIQGQQGPQNPLSKWSKRALIIWIIVFSILVALALRSGRNADNKTRDLVADNKTLIHKVANQAISINDLQAAVKAGCLNYEKLRAASNDFSGIVDTALATAQKTAAAAFRSTGNRRDRVAMNSYAGIRSHIHQVNATCIKPKASK